MRCVALDGNPALLYIYDDEIDDVDCRA